LNFGIGIASGEPIAGHIGSLNKRLDYTLIGDTVNLAARLEKLAGRQGQPQVLTNSETLAKTDSAEFSSILSGTIKIKGKAKPVKVFEIVRLS
jgi:adenylate cyclase